MREEKIIVAFKRKVLLTEQSLLTPEDTGSNPVDGCFDEPELSVNSESEKESESDHCYKT